MSVLRVFLVTLLAGALSISVALFGQRWIEQHPGFTMLPSPKGQAPAVLPDILLTDLNGRAVGSHNWAGKILVMHYWASWCTPCVAQIGALERLQERYGSGVLQVVGVAIDSPEDVAEFLTERPIRYQVLLGGMKEVELAVRLGDRTQSLPFTAIFDSHGKVLFTQTGELSEELLDTKVMQAQPASAVSVAM